LGVLSRGKTTDWTSAGLPKLTVIVGVVLSEGNDTPVDDVGWNETFSDSGKSVGNTAICRAVSSSIAGISSHFFGVVPVVDWVVCPVIVDPDVCPLTVESGVCPLTVDVDGCCVLVESVLNDVDVWSKCEISVNETAKIAFLLDDMCLFNDDIVRR